MTDSPGLAELRTTVETDDDRVLDVLVTGPADGLPLVLHDGTPSSPVVYPAFVSAAAERGIRLVTYARPGYAASTRQPGRTVAQCAADVAAVMDALGADRVLAAGWSGGGPHALATAALLPDRVLAAGTVASVAPWDAGGLDWLAGMDELNLQEFGAALAGPEKLRAFLENWVPTFSAVTGEDVAASLRGLVSEVDRAALTGDFAESLAASLRGAVADGVWGWLDDDIAFTRDWGFDLAAIRVPVTVWQGGEDRMVPFAHGEWLARHVPTARPRLLPEHGHLSIAVASFGSVLDDLIAAAGQDSRDTT